MVAPAPVARVAFRSGSTLFGICIACHFLTSPSVGAGRSIMAGQTFQQFMGPLWGVLKDKFAEWLNATYS